MLKRFIVFFSIIVITAACGLTDPEYVDYEEENASGEAGGGESGATDETSEECQAALTAYTDNLAGPVDSGCAISGCHTTTPIAGEVLSQGNDSANRAALLAYDNTADGSKLYNKIALLEGNSHSGGDKSASLTDTAIRAWKEAEASCK